MRYGCCMRCSPVNKGILINSRSGHPTIATISLFIKGWTHLMIQLKRMRSEFKASSRNIISHTTGHQDDSYLYLKKELNDVASND